MSNDNHIVILPNSSIRGLLSPYGADASDALCDQIREYSALLLRWNEKIALTAVTAPAEIIRFHFGESFFALSLLAPVQGRLADIGSGAGFPGLALKLSAPDLQVTLIESNVKKATFLSEVIRHLSLAHTEVFRGKFEDFTASRGLFDLITARALGLHAQVLRWASARLVQGGRVALWVSGEDAASLAEVKSWIWQPPALIPGTKNRYILVGSPRR